MKRYSEYKDSGVKWIGEIPGHWKIPRLKMLTSFHNGDRSANYPSGDDFVDDGIPFCGADSLCGLYVDLNYARFITDKKYKLLGGFKIRKNDILYTLRGSTIGKNAMALFSEGTVASSLMGIRKTTNRLISNYLLYTLNSICEENQRNVLINGSTAPNLSAEDVGIFSIPLPPLSEQEAIVTYLDSKVAKIDEYISIAEKKIAALEELKQTIIAEAVTRGIHKDVPMKDSGVKWIGMIPEHWKVNKIRSHFKERRVKVSDKDFQALSVAKIGIVPQLEDACKTDNGDNRKQVLKGDFVVNSRSDRKGSCGISPLDGSVSLINIVLRPFNILQEYVHYLFRSHNYIEEFYRNGRGIVADLWTTRYSEMRNIQIPVPPLAEQQEIVNYIEAKVANINQLCQAERSQIEKLKEYKQRLISDVVTGKVKVTND